MGCGCKDTSTKLIEETPELTVKYVLKKIGSTILVGTILIILTPFIVVTVWYLGVKMIIGGNYDYIGMLRKKYGFNKDESEVIEKKEVNPDDYELIDVEVIK